MINHTKCVLTVAAFVMAVLMGSLDPQAGCESIMDQDFDITLAGVQVRPGTAVDVHLKVFVNEQTPSNSSHKTILVVHGTAGNAEHLGPFAEAIFANNPLGSPVNRVVSIDMPGHGTSGLPQGGLLFGELSLDDYATVVLETLERLPSYNIRPKSILGYSMGGLVVQMVQQRLVDQGTNLRKAHKIKQAVLVTPMPPAGISWPNADVNQNLAFGLEQCFSGPGVVSPCGGNFPDVDGDSDVDWTDYAYITWPVAIIHDCDPMTTPLGAFGVMPAPPPPSSGETVTCINTGLGDVFSFDGGAAPYEALRALLESVGAFGYARPVIAAGIFGPSSGTSLGVVEGVNDMTLGIDLGGGFMQPDLMGLYVHLTGDTEMDGYALVDSAGSPPNGHQAIRFAAPLVLDVMSEETDIKLP